MQLDLSVVDRDDANGEPRGRGVFSPDPRLPREHQALTAPTGRQFKSSRPLRRRYSELPTARIPTVICGSPSGAGQVVADGLPLAIQSTHVATLSKTVEILIIFERRNRGGLGSVALPICPASLAVGKALPRGGLFSLGDFTNHFTYTLRIS